MKNLRIEVGVGRAAEVDTCRCLLLVGGVRSLMYDLCFDQCTLEEMAPGTVAQMSVDGCLQNRSSKVWTGGWIGSQEVGVEGEWPWVLKRDGAKYI